VADEHVAALDLGDCVRAGDAFSEEAGAALRAKVSYALTDRGRALIPALEQIALWASEHLADDTA
jgi:hypothetical protein